MPHPHIHNIYQRNHCQFPLYGQLPGNMSLTMQEPSRAVCLNLRPEPATPSLRLATHVVRPPGVEDVSSI